MRREPAAPRVGVALAVKTDDAELMLERPDRLEHRWAFAEAQERGDIRVFDGTRGVNDLDHALCLSVVNQGDRKNGRLVRRERHVGAGDEPRQRVERAHDQPPPHFRLFRFPLLDQ